MRLSKLPNAGLSQKPLKACTLPNPQSASATLESQLDSKLFDRIGRTVQLTEAGAALLPQAEHILQAVRDAKRSIDDLQGEIAGNLSIGISHHIGLHRLPPVLKAFTERYPKVHFDIAFMDSEEAYEQVTHGRIELGVVTLDPTGNSPLTSQAVWQDNLVVTVAPGHALMRVDKPDLTTLSQYRAILPGLNTYTGQIIKTLFQQYKLKLDISMSTNYLETLKMMVSIGLGWSVLPETMIDNHVRTLDIADLNLHRTLGYVHHHNRSLSNAANAFVAALKAESDFGKE